MPISLSNIKVTDGQNNLVITGNDITINGTSILGQNNFVTLDTDQTISGIKTFTKPELIISANYPKFVAKNTVMTRGTYNSSQTECKVIFRDKSDNTLAETRAYVESSDSATSYCIGVVTENENNEAVYKTLYRGTTHKNGTTEVSLEQANNIYINNNLYIKNTNADITDTTNTYNTGIIHYRDKNGIEYFYTKAYQDANIIMYEIAGTYGTDSWKNCFQAGYNRKTGKSFAFIPAPYETTSTSSNQIATTGWVNTVGNNVVHLTGDETISSTKTFTGIIKTYSTKDTTIKLARSDLTRGTTPTSDTWSQVRMDDKNGDWIGFWGSRVNTSNEIISEITARGINGTTTSIICGVTANGNVWTYAHTPATFDNSNNIATTAFVNNKFQVVSALPSSPDSNTFYFIPA